MKKIIKSEKGQALVQFALVLPVMMIMLGLIFDMGRAVHIKINLQHMASEIQKVVVLYEEEGSDGGITTYSKHPTVESSIKEIIDNNTNLDKSKLSYDIQKSNTQERRYIGKYSTWSPSYNSYEFKDIENRNDVKYVTIKVDYELPYGMAITRSILGDSMKLSENITGMMYIGGDGWDEEDIVSEK